MTRNATNALLDDIKRTKGIASDYALAKLLEIKPQTITSYRYGRSHMSDEIAVRATRMMGRPLAVFLVEVAADRASHTEVVKAWRDIAKALLREKSARPGR